MGMEVRGREGERGGEREERGGERRSWESGIGGRGREKMVIIPGQRIVTDLGSILATAPSSGPRLYPVHPPNPHNNPVRWGGRESG